MLAKSQERVKEEMDHFLEDFKCSEEEEVHKLFRHTVELIGVCVDPFSFSCFLFFLSDRERFGPAWEVDHGIPPQACGTSFF